MPKTLTMRLDEETYPDVQISRTPYLLSQRGIPQPKADSPLRCALLPPQRGVSS
jgi:hypothetical protein